MIRYVTLTVFFTRNKEKNHIVLLCIWCEAAEEVTNSTNSLLQKRYSTMWLFISSTHILCSFHVKTLCVPSPKWPLIVMICFISFLNQRKFLYILHVLVWAVFLMIWCMYSHVKYVLFRLSCLLKSSCWTTHEASKWSSSIFWEKQHLNAGCMQRAANWNRQMSERHISPWTQHRCALERLPAPRALSHSGEGTWGQQQVQVSPLLPTPLSCSALLWQMLEQRETVNLDQTCGSEQCAFLLGQS